MAAKTSEASSDKRRKYDEAIKAAALRLASESRSTQAAVRQLGISPKLLYRWQPAQLVTEMGSEEVARDPEVRALRARLKRAEQELDILKKALVSACLKRRLGQPTR
jgi:transposase